jgi:hypothetical protein
VLNLGRLQPFSQTLRLGWKELTETSTLDYYKNS